MSTPPAPATGPGAGNAPAPPPSPVYSAPSGLGTGWSPQRTTIQLPALPRGLDLGLIVVGIGALLTLIGFLCGAASVGQLAPGGSASAYRAWLGSFFVLAGIGIFLLAGGWIYRTIAAARRASLV